MNSVCHLHRVAPPQIVIISSLHPFHRRWLHVFISNVKFAVIFFAAREIVHRYTQAVIFALQVTLDGIGHCQSLKHVTLKNVIMDDIFIDSKLEVLTIYRFLCHRGECQIEYKQHDLEVLYDAHSNGTINKKKKEDT